MGMLACLQILSCLHVTPVQCAGSRLSAPAPATASCSSIIAEILLHRRTGSPPLPKWKARAPPMPFGTGFFNRYLESGIKPLVPGKLTGT